ncbi:unnamed protein product [Caenorhabditis nigoni]
MPIRLLSLPIEDVLMSMDFGDLIAFSVCSKRTKNLVKALNRKMRPVKVFVKENYIRLKVMEENEYDFISFDIFDSYVKLIRNYLLEIWRKQEFTQIAHWIAHFMSIFDDSMIDHLSIATASLTYLNTVKQFFPKCHKLHISDDCSTKLTKIAFWKLFPIAEKMEINKNIFDNENDMFKILTMNLTDLNIYDRQKPFKLEPDDLLALNIARLSIAPLNITEKKLNRFLKLWMTGNHRFYRPKHIELSLRNVINREEVLRGIKFQIVSNRRQLKREDGKKLMIVIRGRYMILDFQV